MKMNTGHIRMVSQFSDRPLLVTYIPCADLTDEMIKNHISMLIFANKIPVDHYAIDVLEQSGDNLIWRSKLTVKVGY